MAPRRLMRKKQLIAVRRRRVSMGDLVDRDVIQRRLS
jgi:hypothetical protein